MRIRTITAALLVTLGMCQIAGANDIRHVFVVDDMTIELEMKEPLTEDETAPKNFTSDTYEPPFVLNEGVAVIGFPVPQRSDGFHDNIYRITVTGMDVGPIYQISYRGHKPKTFKVYPAKEQTDRYRIGMEATFKREKPEEVLL